MTEPTARAAARSRASATTERFAHGFHCGVADQRAELLRECFDATTNPITD